MVLFRCGKGAGGHQSLSIVFEIAGDERQRRTQETAGIHGHSSSPRILSSPETGKPSHARYLYLSNSKDAFLYAVSFQVDNRTLICRTFQRAIVPSHELTRCQSENLLMFLMDNYTEIFKVHLTDQS